MYWFEQKRYHVPGQNQLVNYIQQRTKHVVTFTHNQLKYAN